ncbi:efflux transporter outer membrane subunit [Brevifollis gellanilyticus]|uniref:efflux transporter outer membrane subunit n=1 Tax=Brevifollis gellanilyticus TaxID=748831 RepID=UPI0014795CB7|nr:efflux transporter outer membrane subunit [Brevifollis gellanilyticus]
MSPSSAICRPSLAITASLSLILAGCTVGPDFKLPEMNLSTRWKNKADVSDLGMPDAWWTLYRSPALNRLVDQALTYNQDLATALARVETARAMTGVEKAAWFPQLGMQNAMTLERISGSSFGANLPPNIPLPSLERDRHQAFATLNYEVDLWGKVRRSVEAAKAREGAAIEQVAVQRLVIAAEVARNYFLAASLDSQRQILNETISLRGEALKLQQSRFQGGLANEMDVARARTELELARHDLIGVERQRANAANALALVCGSAPVDFQLASSLALPGAPRISSGLPATLLQRRPDLRVAEQTMREANANIGVAKANFYPSFKLIGSGGIESIGAEDFLDWKNKAGSIGPQLTLPIFQGGRLRGNMRAAYGRYDESVAAYRQAILKALQEVENSVVDLNAYTRQRAAVTSALDAAQETSKLARVRYDKGLASYFEVVDADRTVLTTRLLRAQIDGQRLTASVQLIRSLGGGWGSAK